MALIKCSECGHEVSEKATECPNCGYPISKEANQVNEACKKTIKKNRNTKSWFLLALLFCLIGSGGFFLFSHLKGSGKHVVVKLTPEFINAIQKYEELGSFSEGLAAVKKNDKWGYINKNGVEVIPCQYDFYAGPFHEGLAAVQKDGKFGYIDVNGVEVIPFQYNYHAGPFCEGLAAVQKDDKWGYINAKGVETISLEGTNSFAGNFSEGLACCFSDYLSGTYKFIDKEGNTVFKGEMDPSMYMGEGDPEEEAIPKYFEGEVYIPISYDKYIVFDKKGKKLREVKECPKRNGSLYTIFVKENCLFDGTDGNGTYQTMGVKDANGKEIVPAIYDEIDVSASNGVFCVMLEEFGSEDMIEGYAGVWEASDTKYHYGYVDMNGNDTFSEELKTRCKKARERAMYKIEELQQKKIEEERKRKETEEVKKWLQGRWVGMDSYSGYSIEMIIKGDILIQKIGGQVCYKGVWSYNGDDLLLYNQTSSGGWKDVWRVDKNQRALILDNVPMRKDDGRLTTNSYSLNGSYPYDNYSQRSYRFSSAYDVLGYLSDKTFYNGKNRINIRQEGVYINGICISGAPYVERFESYKALVRANALSGMLSYLIDPINGQVIGEDGAYRLR